MSQTLANLVEVRGISFSRGDRAIFDDISLSVPRGKISAIMGPSGIGKTTLLRLIGGQIRRTAARSCLMAKTCRRCRVRACIPYVSA